MVLAIVLWLLNSYILLSSLSLQPTINKWMWNNATLLQRIYFVKMGWWNYKLKKMFYFWSSYKRGLTKFHKFQHPTGTISLPINTFDKWLKWRVFVIWSSSRLEGFAINNPEAIFLDIVSKVSMVYIECTFGQYVKGIIYVIVMGWFLIC